MTFLIQKSFGDTTLGANLTGTAMIRTVTGDVLRIGRGAGCDLRLAESIVSLEHAELRHVSGALEVVDLGSSSGTFVNGKRVQKAAVRSGDWIEIARTRIEVRYDGPTMPVLLTVRELEEEPVRPGGSATLDERSTVPATKVVDYVSAYRLPSGLFGRRSLSIAGIVLATAALAWLVFGGRLDALRPGRVSQAHASLGSRCFACHAPWVGPVEERCASCHAGPGHQPVIATSSGTPHAAREPPCTACHLEHRFKERLALVTNEICVDCHRDLGALGVPLTGLYDPTLEDFASTGPALDLVTASEHPEFTVPSAGDAVLPVRVRLSSPEQLVDPTLLWLRHDVHLRPDLKSPQGPRQLDCQNCHEYDAVTGEIVPLEYERHCQECHTLEFEQGSSIQVPHATGQEVHAFLLSYYAAQERPVVAAPLQERRRRILPRQRTSESVAPPDISPQVLFRVTRAEAKLFGENAYCDKCHLVAQTNAVPDVEPPERPRPWFDHGRFLHAPHRMRDCETCHQRARTSERTQDVLVPGIQLCRACHGADQVEGADAKTSGPGATTRCVSCHTYHDKTKVGWEAARTLLSVAAPTSREDGVQ